MSWDDAKEQVRSSINLADLVSRYTNLAPAGSRLKGLSPFTNEKTPSFFVDPVAGVYYCFSTQKGGDIFTFVQEMEGVTFGEALKQLAEMASVELPSFSGRANDKNAEKKKKLYEILARAQMRYAKNIPEAVRGLLGERGFTSDSIIQWGLGYAPDGWNTLCNAEEAKDRDAHVASGMCIPKGSRMYDRFRDRIMFPFYDVQGRIIGFSGRALKSSDGAKYINSPESPLFNKSRFLYGFHLAKGQMRRTNTAMLTEGPIDTILAHQAGFPVAVASSGTAVTKEHLGAINLLAKNLLIAFDSDPAGVRATFKIIGLALELGFDVKVVTLPRGEDPASLIQKDKNVFVALVREAKTVVEFVQAHISAEYGDKPEDVVRGTRDIFIPIIKAARDPLVREVLLKGAFEFSGVSRTAMEELLREDVRQVQNRSVAVDSNVSNPKRKTLREKIDEYARNVVSAEMYLKKKKFEIKEPERESILAVKEAVGVRNLEEMDERVVALQYEQIFDEEDREKKIYCFLQKNIRFLEQELHRKKELEKI